MGNKLKHMASESGKGEIQDAAAWVLTLPREYSKLSSEMGNMLVEVEWGIQIKCKIKIT